MSTANETVTLWIRHRPDGYPPLVKDGTFYDENGDEVAEDEDDKVPWRFAEWRKKDLPNKAKKKGNSPKKYGYFYRFTGGNSYFDEDRKKSKKHSAVEVRNGDLDFEEDDGTKHVHIGMESVTVADGWRFHDVAVSGPLVVTDFVPGTSPPSPPPSPLIEINNDTSHAIIASGKIGITVVNYNGPDVYLYVDPDWDNRL